MKAKVPHPSPKTAAKPRGPVAWLRRSVSVLLGKPKKRPPVAGAPGVIPTKAETQLLPPFPGLGPDRIYVPVSDADCQKAEAAIRAAGVTGFDTEAKPTFRAGEKSTGPHVVQFALTDCAYIFQLRNAACVPTVAALIASDKVLKVGFGLRNDHGQIRDRLGVTLRHVVDLDHVFRQRGYKGQIGVRGAVGVVLRQHFGKSKSVTTSNWAAAHLTERQLDYAANDAYAALKILEALELPAEELAAHSRARDHQPKKKDPAPRRRRR